MPDWWQFLILILATWRIVSFIQDESGPFNVMVKIRSLLGIVPDSEGKPVGWPDNLVGSLFKCFWCLSFWVGLILWAIWMYVPLFPLIFAISAGAILINEIISRLHDGKS